MDRVKQHRAEEILFSLAAAVRASQLYERNHPLLESTVGKCIDSLAKFTGKFHELRLLIVGTEFIFENVPFLRNIPTVKNLAVRFNNLKIEKVTLRAGITRAEVNALVTLLTAQPNKVLEHGGVNKYLNRITDILHMKFYRFVTDTQPLSEATSAKAATTPPLDLFPDEVTHELQIDFYGHLQQRAMELVDDYKTSKTINAAKTNIFVETVCKNPAVDIVNIYREHSFRDDPSKDGPVGHALRVALVAEKIARSLEMPLRTLQMIAAGAFWHDVFLLNDDSEKKDYRTHPAKGALILRSQQSTTATDRLPTVIALEHHQGFTREKFPELKTGVDPHPASLLVALANTMDRFFLDNHDAGEMRDFFESDDVFIDSDRERTLFDLAKTELLPKR